MVGGRALRAPQEYVGMGLEQEQGRKKGRMGLTERARAPEGGTAYITLSQKIKTS